jgi:hypothetical protein
VILLEKSVATGIACSRSVIVSAGMRPRTAAAGRNLLKLEHMDQVAQFTVIAAVGDRRLERRIGALAEQAAALNFNAVRL